MERLTSLFLSIPELLITRRHYRFSDPPLRWLDTVITAFYPFAIGLVFLMPIDLIFSTLVFYALYHGQDVLGRAVGWHLLPNSRVVISNLSEVSSVYYVAYYG